MKVNGKLRAVLLVPALAPSGDLNASGTVDAADLGIPLGAWGSSGAADLDHNGSVGFGHSARAVGVRGRCP